MPDADIVRSIAEERTVARILVRYCNYLDLMELDALAALFTADCVVSYGIGEHLTSRGRTNLRRDLERLWRWQRTSHHLSNIDIEFDGPHSAHARSYVLAWHERADGTTATVYGRYEDRFLRREHDWLIAERTMFMNGHDAGFALALHPTPRRESPAGWQAPDIDA